MALLNLSPIPVRTRMRRWARGIFWLLLAIGFALSWMLFPYFLNGRQVLGDVGYSIQAERMSRSTATARLLIRNAEGPGDADVDVLYATTEYLTLIDPSGAARKYEPSRYLIFFVTETAHVGVLPADAPSGTLLIDVSGVRQQASSALLAHGATK